MSSETDQVALLLTIPEVARALKISRALAYLLAASGEIPAVRIGRAVRVPVRALERYIADKLGAESR